MVVFWWPGKWFLSSTVSSDMFEKVVLGRVCWACVGRKTNIDASTLGRVTGWIRITVPVKRSLGNLKSDKCLTDMLIRLGSGVRRSELQPHRLCDAEEKVPTGELVSIEANLEQLQKDLAMQWKRLQRSALASKAAAR